MSITHAGPRARNTPGLSALFGAALVVPDLPAVYLTGTPFPDYTVPAIGLGLVGVSAFAALAATLLRPALGAEANVATGAMIIVFEGVEALTVGNLLSLPAGVTASDTSPLWLQPFFVVYGCAMVGLGTALWARLDPQHTWSARVRHPLQTG